MDSFSGKVVIVTGASRGIGASVAKLLQDRGARLVLGGRDEELLGRVASSEDLIVAGDLTNPDIRARLIEETLRRFGRIDCLINNAGRGSYFKVSEAPMEDTRAMFEVNFFAPLHLAQLAIPHLRATRGSLVNVSSIAGQISLPWLPVYSATKFALASITASQRMELRASGVNAMTVFPGYVDTEFQAHASGSKPPLKIVKGKRFAVSAMECARAIVKGIEKRRRVVVTPSSGRLLMWLNHLAPAAVEARLRSV